MIWSWCDWEKLRLKQSYKLMLLPIDHPISFWIAWLKWENVMSNGAWIYCIAGRIFGQVCVSKHSLSTFYIFSLVGYYNEGRFSVYPELKLMNSYSVPWTLVRSVHVASHLIVTKIARYCHYLQCIRNYDLNVTGHCPKFFIK